MVEARPHHRKTQALVASGIGVRSLISYRSRHLTFDPFLARQLSGAGHLDGLARIP